MNIKSAILFLLLGCAPLAQGASLYVSAPAYVTAGEAFLFDINLAPGSDLLGGLDVSVYFDPSAFTFNNADFGPALGDADQALQQWSEVSAGKLSLLNLSFLESASLADIQQNSLELFALSFTAHTSASGVYSFLVDVNDAVSASAEPLSINALSGQVQVVPLPAAAGFLLVGLSGLCTFVRRRL